MEIIVGEKFCALAQIDSMRRPSRAAAVLDLRDADLFVFSRHHVLTPSGSYVRNDWKSERSGYAPK